jgi:hypothetical protein
MDLQIVEWGCTDYIVLVHYRDRWRELVTALMNLRVPLNAGNFLCSLRPVNISGRAVLHCVSSCAVGVELGAFGLDNPFCSVVENRGCPRHEAGMITKLLARCVYVQLSRMSERYL